MKVPRSLRLNAMGTYVFPSTQSEVERLLDEVCPAEIKKRDFEQVISHCTNEQYSFMAINRHAPPGERIRKNLSEVVDLDKFKTPGSVYYSNKIRDKNKHHNKNLDESLMKMVSASPGNPDTVEGELRNPDVPDGDLPTPDVAPRTITDQYYTFMNINKNIIRNGDEYSLGLNHSVNPRWRDFNDEGHIDPANQRQEIDPAGAPPENWVGGSRGEVYALPKTALVGHDNVSLVQSARQNYVNYKNRFELPNPSQGKPESNQPETSVPLLRGISLGPSTRDVDTSIHHPPMDLPVGPELDEPVGPGLDHTAQPDIITGTAHEKYRTPYEGIDGNWGPAHRGTFDTGATPVPGF
jgi:hypothetical protein